MEIGTIGAVLGGIVVLVILCFMIGQIVIEIFQIFVIPGAVLPFFLKKLSKGTDRSACQSTS